MDESTRTLKVYYHTTPQGDIPRIILQGRWLEELGYSVGDFVSVTISGQTITIQAIKHGCTDKR